MKTFLAVLACTACLPGQALDYPYAPYHQGKLDPQTTGWPLTEAERKYVLLPEHERRPGREDAAHPKHLPTLWPVTPSAGFWGGTSWLDMHANLVKEAQANQGPIDVLLVGDSLTIQWGAAWKQHFPTLKTVNIGLGGDKTQNVLWRLDHGAVDGLEPRLCVLLIGNNNMFITPETGTASVAQGIKACAENLREKFPLAPVIVVKVFPAHAPGNPFYEDIKRVNAALDTLNLEADPKVRVLDIWGDLVNADGTVRKELFRPDNIHLSPDGGYQLYAEKLQPLLTALLAGRPVPKSAPKPGPAAATLPDGDDKPTRAKAEPTGASHFIPDGRSLVYPYAPYNEGKLDPQLTGWPVTDAERAWVAKGEYTRKPGHEVQKHLPEMWFVTPTAARWGKEGEENLWLAHHATGIEKVRAMKDGIAIALLGDSITQGWGGGWDGAPFNTAWQKHFGDQPTVNLGLGGDRSENLLWRLDHGALDGASPKVIVLMIGVNNAPLVFANGAPAASAARGIKLCVENLRLRCPKSQIVLVKILPAFDPSREAGKAVVDINTALDALKLDRDPQVHVLDLWRDFTTADGTLDPALYTDGHLHLAPAGYERLAGKLQPLIQTALAGGPKPPAPATPRYLLLNVQAPTRRVLEEIRVAVPQPARSQVQVGFSFIVSYLAREDQATVAYLKQGLNLARETGLPVFVWLDGEYWWQHRPDLWNWWDATKPGFNPQNRENVEWHAWQPEAALKISWLNWGRQIRMLPPPNLMSPRYRAACHEQMRLLVPILLSWWAALPPDQKHLLAGVKVGWESSIGVNNFYYPNGNDLLDQPAANDPQYGIKATEVPARGLVQLGYAAVKTAGIRSVGQITEADLAEVARRHLEDLARLASELGVPRDRLFTHAAGWKEKELLYGAAVNVFSCPGWSFYRHAGDPSKDAGVQEALAHSDAPYWGAVEWLFQGPRTTAAWRNALEKTLADPRCRLICLVNWSDIKDNPAAQEALRQVAAGKP